MSSNWITDLDTLAMAGILDFDAASYVRGTTPRYVGNPKTVPLLPELPKNGPFAPSPSSDEFINSEKKDNEIVKNAPWKKWAMAGTIIAAIAYVGCRIAGVKIKTPAFLKNLGTKISSFFSKLKPPRPRVTPAP